MANQVIRTIIGYIDTIEKNLASREIEDDIDSFNEELPDVVQIAENSALINLAVSDEGYKEYLKQYYDLIDRIKRFEKNNQDEKLVKNNVIFHLGVPLGEIYKMKQHSLLKKT
ncbi:MAG: hypothetical protein ACW99F_17775 [Candidatus Hodarchaeales archaeon]